MRFWPIVVLFYGSSAYSGLIPDVEYFDKGVRAFSTDNNGTKPFIIDSNLHIYYGDNSIFHLDFEGPARYINPNNDHTIAKSLCVDNQGPRVDIEAPKTGSHLNVSEHYVAGRVSDKESGVASLYLSGQKVNIANDRFNATLQLVHGLNTLLFDAIDNAGLKTRRSANFYASNAWLPSPKSTKADVSSNMQLIVGEQLLKQGIENGVLDLLNDYFELKLATLPIQDMLLFSRPFYAGCALFNFKLDATLQKIDAAKMKVTSVSLENGGLRFRGSFGTKNNYSARVTTRIDLNFYFFDTPVTVSEYFVNFDLNNLSFNFKLAISKGVNKKLDIHVEELAFDDATTITVQPPASGDSFFAGPVFQRIASDVLAQKTQIMNGLAKLLNNNLRDLQFDDWRFKAPWDLRSVEVFGKPHMVDVKKAAATIGIGAFAVSQKSTKPDFPVPLWNGCDQERNATAITPDPKLAVLRVDYNAANQVLNALWQTGAFDLDASASAFAMGFNLADIGISNFSFRATPLMPPFIDDCGPSERPTFQVGDFLFSFSFDLFGRPIVFDARLSLVADLKIAVENETLVLEIQNADATSFDIDLIRTGENSDKQLLESIFLEAIHPRIKKGFLRIPFAPANFALPNLSLQLRDGSFRFSPGAIEITLFPQQF